MPIYEYHCLECGHASDVLQKVSDPQLVDCPACGKAEYRKKISAPGFQLKGTGWYETDFKNKSSADDKAGKPAARSADSEAAGSTGDKKPAPASAGKSDSSGGSTASAA
jgi:putative FmdB family regulatory protein